MGGIELEVFVLTIFESRSTFCVLPFYIIMVLGVDLYFLKC